MNRIPSYLYLYENLKKQIKNGNYGVGDKIPSEPILESTYNVSRTTVRKAVSMLSREGYVIKKQGKGTIVMDFKAVQKLNYVSSFSETCKELGMEVVSRDKKIEMCIPPETIAQEFDLEGNEKIIRIHRVQLADNTPIAVMENYILPKYVPNIETKIDRIDSLYKLLEYEYDVVISSATDFITACGADEEIARLLDVEVGTPLLDSKRITYSNDEIIEVALVKVVADKYTYCIHMNKRK